jgi:hypothetical protein
MKTILRLLIIISYVIFIFSCNISFLEKEKKLHLNNTVTKIDSVQIQLDSGIKIVRNIQFQKKILDSLINQLLNKPKIKIIYRDTCLNKPIIIYENNDSAINVKVSDHKGIRSEHWKWDRK